MARSGIGAWNNSDIEGAAEGFAGAALLDPENSDRIYDLGTTLAAGGQAETAMALLEAADAGGVTAAAYNAGTAALQQNQAEAAVKWLRKAVLDNSDDPDVKRNYELALKLLEQQEQEQEKQDENEDENKDEEQEEQQQDGQEPTPTPTPSPSGAEGAQPTPTPTPDPNNPLYSALEQAESDAREAMRSRTPQAVTVEKDW